LKPIARKKHIQKNNSFSAVITVYIITTVKHAILLVNSRAGSGYRARGIKMPSRDFRGILKMSLFHYGYFIKQLPNGFPSRIA
jgi:hypothetical protein